MAVDWPEVACWSARRATMTRMGVLPAGPWPPQGPAHLPVRRLVC
jgi:hypothetical protein